MKKLTAKERQFCVEYVACNVGTEAATKAGYSAKTARSKASQLLTKVNIQEEIGTLKEKQEKRTLVDADYVIRGLKTVAERCIQARPKMVYNKESKEYEQAINEETGELLFEFDSMGANKAFQLLGETCNAFKQTVDVNLNTYEHFQNQINKHQK